MTWILILHSFPDDFSPYGSRVQFEVADLIYHKVQMSSRHVDELCQLWAATTGGDPPFASKEDLYDTIDATTTGNIPPWQCVSITMDVDANQDEPIAPWKTAAYEIYYRDPKAMLHSQLVNPDFKTELDVSPKWVFDQDNKRIFKDFMSGNWAWQQAVCTYSLFNHNHNTLDTLGPYRWRPSYSRCCLLSNN